MKTVNAYFFTTYDSKTDPYKVSVLLDHAKRYRIDQAPWKSYAVKNVTTTFSIAHGKDCIFLKYYVEEPRSTAIYLKSNDPVYKDSCVEFFLAIDSEAEYYNFEFNHAGTCLLAFGTATDRNFIDPKIINQIKYARSFTKSSNQNLVSWELTLMIPFTTLCFHHIESLQSLACKANFYKCGDNLPAPHYFAWNNIANPSPNFHLPEFFGRLDFIH